VVGAVVSRRGDGLVSQAQRARILASAVRVVAAYGFGEMSIARITQGAGVSRRTFYDLFEDREHCFFEVFDEAVARAREVMAIAWKQDRGWREQTRASLLALLVLLDREPELRAVLITDALKAGPRVQQRRVEVLAELSGFLHEQGTRPRSGRELPGLTGEGVTGAVLGVLHTHTMTKRPGGLVDLLGPLMGILVLPYLGPAAAHRELERPAPNLPAPTRKPNGALGAGELPPGGSMRITHRTLLVLSVVAASPGSSNRELATGAGISDQGQISKLLARLETRGLIANTSGGQPLGEPNSWQLTPYGRQVQQATQRS
jgi:AcrR family transcriptional regulator